jgi:hypothetical protein
VAALFSFALIWSVYGKYGRSPEYGSWREMHRRCLNPRSPKYPQYGGRGITICKQWLKSFEAFLKDMGPRPSLDHSLERIDNDGNYEPANCRRGTRSDQQRNRRQCNYVTAFGKTKCMTEWAEIFNIPVKSLSHAVEKLGKEAFEQYVLYRLATVPNGHELVLLNGHVLLRERDHCSK